MSTEILPITAQDVEDAANLFLMSVNAYIGFEKSGLELAGAAHIILTSAVQELNRKHEQTTSSENQSGEGIEAGPGEISGTGSEGRSLEGAQGDGKNVQGTASKNAPKQSQDKSSQR